MFRFLLNILSLRLASNFSADLERRWEHFQGSVKRTSFGVLLLQVSGPFFAIGFGFLIAAIFLKFAAISHFVMPSVWTGLITLGFAVILALWAALAFRR